MTYDALLKKIEKAISLDKYEELEEQVDNYLTKLQEDGILDENGLQKKEVK